jgi:hypothetical protein
MRQCLRLHGCASIGTVAATYVFAQCPSRAPKTTHSSLHACMRLYVCGHRAGDARKSLLDKLQGYDYDPSAQPDEVYPDDSASQIADDDHRVNGGSRPAAVDLFCSAAPMRPG